MTIIPRSCVLCGEVLGPGPGPGPSVCEACLEECEAISGEVCGRCGRKLISEAEWCTTCRHRDDGLRNVAAAEYRGRLREVISLYKLSGHRELGAILALILGRSVGSLLSGARVIPVPPSPQRLASLKWDPVRDLLRRLSPVYDFVVVAPLLRGKGVQQKELGYEERLDNAKRVYRLSADRSQEAGKPELKTILFDDIFTTGATLSACRDLLRREGYVILRSVTLAVD